MKFVFLFSLSVFFLSVGCANKDITPEADENLLVKTKSEKSEVKDVQTPQQKAKQQLAKEIKRNEKNCDKGETQACWDLVATYLHFEIENSFYSSEKAEAAFQKLCKQENVTCFKNDVKIKEAKNPDVSKEAAHTFMYSDKKGKFKSYSYKEYGK